MEENSSLWEFRADASNYSKFFIKGIYFDKALVCLDAYPCIILLSPEFEIHINHIERISKKMTQNYTCYCVEHLDFSSKGELRNHKYNIKCFKS